MTQNRSHAVMAQRHEAHDSLDDFPTQPFATRALFEHILIGGGFRRDQLATMTCREPAANRGHMAKPLAEYLGDVEASDVHDYGGGYPLRDFLFPGKLKPVDWTITNPPYKLGAEFVLRALETSRVGVAVFVRVAFLEGITRYGELYSRARPSFYAPFVERVPLYRGRLLNPDKEYWNPVKERMEKPSTATAYAWLVWCKTNYHATQTWQTKLIPPCRRDLTRFGDYPDDEVAA